VKEDAITWGDLDSYELAVEKSAEVIVVVEMSPDRSGRSHRSMKD
jgi:hypothetical protein